MLVSVASPSVAQRNLTPVAVFFLFSQTLWQVMMLQKEMIFTKELYSGRRALRAVSPGLVF
jgi:hypothetical protein